MGGGINFRHWSLNWCHNQPHDCHIAITHKDEYINFLKLQWLIWFGICNVRTLYWMVINNSHIEMRKVFLLEHTNFRNWWGILKHYSMSKSFGALCKLWNYIEINTKKKISYKYPVHALICNWNRYLRKKKNFHLQKLTRLEIIERIYRSIHLVFLNSIIK